MDRVHLGAQVDEISRLLAALVPDKAAILIERDRRKDVTQGGMSRTPSPTLAAPAIKFSWVLREAAPYAAGVEPPTRMSWAPLVSSITENNTRPMSGQDDASL